MEKPREQVRIELNEVTQSEHADKQESKLETHDLDVSELEPRVAPVVPQGYWF